jgi:SAM-dependent methyltransferase
VARRLAERYRLVGVDISAGQIKRARRNVSGARFIHGDILAQSFAAGTFDAAVMLYAMFHVPRDQQPLLIARIRQWLKPNGLLLATLARSSHSGYIEDDFFGTSMYWSHFAEDDYYPILQRPGFELMHKRRIGHGYTKPDDGSESHPLILARRAAAVHE